jgi:hypothetical protein
MMVYACEDGVVRLWESAGGGKKDSKFLAGES